MCGNHGLSEHLLKAVASSDRYQNNGTMFDPLPGLSCYWSGD